ncbi:MFS transporter [Streptomyces sp. RS10V-4]|uniref:MFS transporter n=1 Tax=Streptomyces rhizoryzae TaxID=2932493 RepID=UPI002005FC93|nr:MFS transporter [Streptomyces rhizoryzae]MCK7621776.1 MFS transporter [Streptomyces rhizoryzae]
MDTSPTPVRPARPADPAPPEPSAPAAAPRTAPPAPAGAAGGGRPWGPAVLTLGAFTLGTGEIMIAGLLPDVAADAGVPLSTAGLLVSVFALTVVVGGPVLALATTAVRRRTLLTGLLALYALGGAVSALAPGFPLIAAGRVASALAHAGLMPLFFGLAADVVPAHRRGTAVARVSLGLGLAMVAGLPIGTALGQWLSWRAAFAAVALLTLAVAGPVLALVRAAGDPADGDADAGTAGGRAAELRVLGERRVQAVVTVTALSAAAAFTAYTYVTPLLTDTVGVEPRYVTVLLLLFGTGGTLGNLLGGKLADRSVTGAVCAGVLALAGSLLLLGAAVAVRPLAVAALFLFGAAYYAVIPAVNTRLLNVASQRARTLALTVQSSAFNLGIAGGGWLGGQLLTGGVALRWVPVAGGAVALLALAAAGAEHRGERRRARAGAVSGGGPHGAAADGTTGAGA